MNWYIAFLAFVVVLGVAVGIFHENVYLSPGEESYDIIDPEVGQDGEDGESFEISVGLGEEIVCDTVSSSEVSSNSEMNGCTESRSKTNIILDCEKRDSDGIEKFQQETESETLLCSPIYCGKRHTVTGASRFLGMFPRRISGSVRESQVYTITNVYEDGTSDSISVGSVTVLTSSGDLAMQSGSSVGLVGCF